MGGWCTRCVMYWSGMKASGIGQKPLVLAGTTSILCKQAVGMAAEDEDGADDMVLALAASPASSSIEEEEEEDDDEVVDEEDEDEGDAVAASSRRSKLTMTPVSCALATRASMHSSSSFIEYTTKHLPAQEGRAGHEHGAVTQAPVGAAAAVARTASDLAHGSDGGGLLVGAHHAVGGVVGASEAQRDGEEPLVPAEGLARQLAAWHRRHARQHQALGHGGARRGGQLAAVGEHDDHGRVEEPRVAAEAVVVDVALQPVLVQVVERGLERCAERRHVDGLELLDRVDEGAERLLPAGLDGAHALLAREQEVAVVALRGVARAHLEEVLDGRLGAIQHRHAISGALVHRPARIEHKRKDHVGMRGARARARPEQQASATQQRPRRRGKIDDTPSLSRSLPRSLASVLIQQGDSSLLS